MVKARDYYDHPCLRFRWRGWNQWLIGFIYHRENGVCWLWRWLVAVGPFDIGWRVR